MNNLKNWTPEKPNVMKSVCGVESLDLDVDAFVNELKWMIAPLTTRSSEIETFEWELIPFETKHLADQIRNAQVLDYDSIMDWLLP